MQRRNRTTKSVFWFLGGRACAYKHTQSSCSHHERFHALSPTSAPCPQAPGSLPTTQPPREDDSFSSHSCASPMDLLS